MTRGEFNPISRGETHGDSGKSGLPRVFLALIIASILLTGVVFAGIHGAAAQSNESGSAESIAYKQLDASTVAKDIRWLKDEDAVELTIEGSGSIVFADNIRFEDEESAPLQRYRINGEERIRVNARTRGSKQSLTVVTQNRMVLLEHGSGVDAPNIGYLETLLMALFLVIFGSMAWVWWRLRNREETTEEVEPKR